MESIYYRPRNGALQKVFVSEVRNKTVFRFQQKRSESEEEDGDYEDKEDNGKKNLTGKVVRLYDQCMELLSNYTHCFESLVDFPEDFGKEIFEKAVNKLVADSENTKKTVGIFCEAYPETFLSQCKLSNMLMINNYELCLPMILTSTIKLELTGCQLDDEHDLLAQLVHLPLLEVLCLAENQLTDKGLRRLLLPAVGGKHLARLAYLDLAHNRLEKRALTRINLVQSLRTVVFGEKDFKPNEVVLTLKNSFRLRKCPRFEKVETSGFGRKLLDIWSEKSKVKDKPKKPKCEGFYSKPRVVPFSNKASVSDDAFKNKLMFERKALMEVSNNIKKRKADVTEDVEVKKYKVAEDVDTRSEFDQNLLSLYM